jgi:hypothetical protein
MSVSTILLVRHGPAYRASQGGNFVLIQTETLTETDRQRCPHLELLEKLVTPALPKGEPWRKNKMVCSLDGELHLPTGRAVGA